MVKRDSAQRNSQVSSVKKLEFRFPFSAIHDLMAKDESTQISGVKRRRKAEVEKKRRKVRILVMEKLESHVPLSVIRKSMV